MTEDFEVKEFDYCDKVDLHALDFSAPLDSVVAVAAEHGFRGILVTLGRLDQLVKEINKPIYGDRRLLPICAIDYPLGTSGIETRTYSILMAKEKGAKEVEIVAPYQLIVDRDFRRLYEDAQNMVNTANKHDLSLKYIIDQNSKYVDDGVRAKLCRIMSSTRVPFISTSIGFNDKNQEVDHSDNIIRMRNIKSKSGCSIKAFINSDDPEDLASYVKAGADLIGLQWNKAPQIVHGYEDMVQNKTQDN